MIRSFRFHHLGLATRSLEAEAGPLAELGYQAEGEDFIDPVQGVRGRFLVGPGPRLELLTELEGSAVLQAWLSKGVKLYHHAFEVGSLQDSVVRLEAGGARVVTPAVGATAFGGRQISFLMLPNLMLIELIERKADASPAAESEADQSRISLRLEP